MKRIEKNLALPVERPAALIIFHSSRGAGDLTDVRLRSILAAQTALQLALDSAYCDLRAGARYIGTSLRLSEDGSSVVQGEAASCRKS